jgi:hypothetical protein
MNVVIVLILRTPHNVLMATELILQHREMFLR